MIDVTQDTIDYMLNNKVEAANLLRISLKYFIQVFHYYMFRRQFIFKSFHYKIIEKLENIVFGRAEKKNLYIGIAPRFGKSQIMQYFICWSYAINKSCNFIMTSYGDKLVLKFSGQSKAIIESPLYNALFDLRCVKDTTAKDLWKIEDGGEFRASSMGGTLTGFGAGTTQEGFGGALIIDDALKADNYKSVVEKQNCIDVYTNTLKSRLNSQETPTIIIAQRLAVDDLVGWIKENEPEDWDFFVLPTLDENDKSIWQEKMPAETLIKMRESNPFLFYSQYQQEPIILGGSVIREEWFRYYASYQNVEFSRLFITADTALKVKEANDFTAIGLWGLTYNNELYLLDLLHGKWEAPDLERQFIAFWNKWRNGVNGRKTNGAYIEDKASGTGLIQTIKYKGVPVIPYEPEKDKLTRVMDVSPYIESGLLYLPMSKDFDISKKVVNECVAFTADMSHAHDDICFVGDTMVATKSGCKKIKDISVGDYVLTPCGYSRVIKTKNRMADVITNIGLTGTENHKVFTNDDYFVDNLKNLTYNRVVKLKIKDFIKWKIKAVFVSTVLNTTAIHRMDILQVLMTERIKGVELDFIGLFMSFIRDKKYLLAMKFIIKTLIGIIMSFLTLFLFRVKNIINYIKKGFLLCGKEKKCKRQVQEVGNDARNGTQVKKEKNGTRYTKNSILKKSGFLKFVKSVAKHLERSKTKDIKYIAENAGTSFLKENYENRRRVYNICVENGMYYANDVLVSNCDMMTMALSIAFLKTPMKIAKGWEAASDAINDYY